MNLCRWLTIPLLMLLLGLLAACIVERRPDNSTLIYIPPPGVAASGTIPELALATVLTRVPTTVTATMTATATITGTTVLTMTPTVTTPISGTITPKPSATGTLIATAATPRGTTTRIGTPTSTRQGIATRSTSTPRATATRRATVARTPTPTRKPTATATRKPTATSATPRPTPTSIPETVFLGRNQGFTEGGDYYVVGEVLNGSAYPVFNVKVIGSFYDANNSIVAAQEVTTFFVQIEPELSSPFKLRVSNAGGAIDRYELTLVWDDISIVDYEELIIERGEFDEEAREIFGDLRNDGSVSVQGMIVAVTLYSDEGEIMDVLLGSTDQEILPAGESTSYTIAIPTGIEFERFEVQAQGALKLF